jgi:hypothetical protein
MMCVAGAPDPASTSGHPRRMSIFDRRIIVCAAALGALAASFVLAVPQGTAPPEPESPAARNFRRVDRYFPVSALLNLAQGTVRIVTIVPVDKASSFAVIDTVLSVVAANQSKRLRAYVILRGESGLQALQLATRYSDARVAYFWDPTTAVASAWESGTTTEGTAWLYDTSAKFSDRAPPAALTVVATTDEEVVMVGRELRAEANAMVRRVEAKMASAPKTESN